MKGLWTKDIRLISSQQKNLAVIWLVAAGILIATDQISFAITYTSVRSEEIVMTVLLNIPMLLIFQSMALPFLLKYEAEKGRIALAAMIGGIVFVVIFFFKMFETAGIELIDIVMNQMYLKNITLWASIYIISIVIWFLSLKIAEGIMLKKEF